MFKRLIGCMHECRFLFIFLECPANTYKDTIGNEKCTDCPKNSKSSTGETRCVCNDNYYRFQGHNFTQPCYGECAELIVRAKLDTCMTGTFQIHVETG